MLGNIGFTELLIILLVALLVFGAKRLPEIGSSIGKGIREFKKSVTETSDALNSSVDDRSALPPRQFDSTAQSTPPSGDPKRLSQ